MTPRSCGSARPATRGAILTEFPFASLALRASRGDRRRVRASARCGSRTPATSTPAYRDVFGVPVTFGAAADELELDAAQLELPLASADPITSAALEAKVEKLTRGARRPRSSIACGAPLELARCRRRSRSRSASAISARTLRRHLEQESRSLRAIVDDVRRERADELLAAGTRGQGRRVPLGFSEPSAFSRAYKRWTGGRAGSRGWPARGHGRARPRRCLSARHAHPPRRSPPRAAAAADVPRPTRPTPDAPAVQQVAPAIPQPTGTCPAIANGDVTFAPAGMPPRKVKLALTRRRAGHGELVIYWHATGSSPLEAAYSLGSTLTTITRRGRHRRGAVRRSDRRRVRVVHRQQEPEARRLPARRRGRRVPRAGGLIDPTHIHSMGMSAGALQTTAVSFLRSSYIASVATYSGGMPAGLHAARSRIRRTSSRR